MVRTQTHHIVVWCFITEPKIPAYRRFYIFKSEYLKKKKGGEITAGNCSIIMLVIITGSI